MSNREALKNAIPTMKGIGPKKAGEVIENLTWCAGLRPQVGQPAIGQTKLGGMPDLANGVKWPENQGFLCQLRFEELAPFDDRLPKHGLLLVFCDLGDRAFGIEESPDCTAIFQKGTAFTRASAPPSRTSEEDEGRDSIPVLPETGLVACEGVVRGDDYTSDFNACESFNNKCKELGIGRLGAVLSKLSFFHEHLEEYAEEFVSLLSFSVMDLHKELEDMGYWEVFPEADVKLLIAPEDLELGQLEKAIVIIDGGT